LRHLVTLMGLRDIRELRQERLVGRIASVAEDVVRTLVRQAEQPVQERTVTFRERSQIDVDDVVFQPAAIRKSGEIARKDTKAIARAGGCGGCDRSVESQ